MAAQFVHCYLQYRLALPLSFMGKIRSLCGAAVGDCGSHPLSEPLEKASMPRKTELIKALEIVICGDVEVNFASLFSYK
jgi:hypothetical protein